MADEGMESSDATSDFDFSKTKFPLHSYEDHAEFFSMVNGQSTRPWASLSDSDFLDYVRRKHRVSSLQELQRRDVSFPNVHLSTCHHQIFFGAVLYLQRIPPYMMSPAFWAWLAAAGDEATYASARGFMRTWCSLVRDEDDFRLAIDGPITNLIPCKAVTPAAALAFASSDTAEEEGKKVTFESFMGFLAQFAQDRVPDSAVAPRYAYGELKQQVELDGFYKRISEFPVGELKLLPDDNDFFPADLSEIVNEVGDGDQDEEDNRHRRGQCNNIPPVRIRTTPTKKEIAGRTSQQRGKEVLLRTEPVNNDCDDEKKRYEEVDDGLYELSVGEAIVFMLVSGAIVLWCWPGAPWPLRWFTLAHLGVVAAAASVSTLIFKPKNWLFGHKKKPTVACLRKGETGTEEKETLLPLLGPSDDCDDDNGDSNTKIIKEKRRLCRMLRDILAALFVLDLMAGGFVIWKWPGASEELKQVTPKPLAVFAGFFLFYMAAPIAGCICNQWASRRGAREVKEETKMREESEGRKAYGGCDVV
ncbi:hypothetical protein PG997_013657 [Apiospora hydei]|uniref:Uncharacterized protein n=1 Tax=Apiospora hydei TaxID=1337664 RepID=A0ABR1V6U4_9PEZI